MRFQVCASAVGALTAAVLAVSTTPAVASGTYSGRAYIYGADAFGNDWGDEGVLSTSTHRNSNATCMWQELLVADGKLEWDQIDGEFGPDTYNATVRWQTDYNRYWRGSDPVITVDGSVGKATFGAADKFLSAGNGDIVYTGAVHNVRLERDADGNYTFLDQFANRRKAGYDYLSCSS
ncbi:peptidoglycan-binding protein [Actinacidiphila glaucinigra]|uniref:peptidoglycan-binding domain-containing protein n=1 Tax=Actinacidiphila glaucinigra TaxID=235986 RepID=UPI002DD823BE|nr:peptidoglycan-binding protein [Actinacidiphila glaucinigra]WSD57745.1 peptidoglycan-binding protein [Actinacidiphila glaucinigra]